jgi:hypothetical protein
MNDPTDTSRDGQGKAETSTRAVTTAEVLCAEYRWLWPDDPQPPTNEEEYYAKLTRAEQQAALCLSGGGIRSAAFALGVLQALSRKNLLTGFHYLSTVSGGGYIGSFIQRWIKEAPGGAADVMDGLGAERERDEVKKLREYSNFITPRVGLGSNDTWTAVAISIRNIIVNWFLFLPLLLLVALLPNLFLSGVLSVPVAVARHWWFDDVLLGGAGLSIFVSVFSMVPLLMSYRSHRLGVAPGAGDQWLFWRVIFPILLWAILGTLALAPDLLELLAKAEPGGETAWPAGTRLALVTLAGMVLGWLAASIRIERLHRPTFWDDAIVWPMSFVVVVCWLLLGALLFGRLTYQTGSDWTAALLTTIGPLWLTGATMIAAIFFVAFRRSEGPTIKPDADRELIARISAIKFKPMLAWALAGFSALLLSSLLRSWGAWDVSISSAVAALAGGGAVAGGRSDRSGNAVKETGTKLLGILPFSMLITLATFLFIIAMFVLLGGLEFRLAEIIEKPLGPWFDPHPWLDWVDSKVASHLAIAALLVVLLVFLSKKIEANRFSLNGLYRNRLARAFLGAARASADPPRDPNPFTGFDSFDNIRMHMLRGGDDGVKGPRVLYPVINCALNVTKSENLAWQERMAQPFMFSLLYSGGGLLRGGAGAYVSSRCYGGSEPDLALGTTTGVTLATAMSISGAAASPNMGYHSSAATAFLMTLFNVRLGAWLPNPARATDPRINMTRSSPKNSLSPLLAELGGSTDDRGEDVYLSDGGHFENLGLYEMLRRRCTYIVVSDAGADPACAFSDLGGAVRKAKIDFDIEIGFGKMCISRRGEDIKPQLAWAIGKIRYPGGATGTILYLKPSFFGKALPVDIVAYAKESDTFPHESTGDQWFSESQFESYRHLGFHFADALGPGMKGETVKDFFDAASADYASLNPQPLPPKAGGAGPQSAAASPGSSSAPSPPPSA